MDLGGMSLLHWRGNSLDSLGVLMGPCADAPADVLAQLLMWKVGK